MKNRMLAALLCLILLSSCGGTPEPVPLEELPEDYSLEQAKADGCLVTEDGTITSGRESWEDFLEAVDAGKSASVRLCSSFTLDSLGVSSWYDPDYYASIKDDYPNMSLEDLSYDGEEFTSVFYQEGKRCEENYSLLLKPSEEGIIPFTPLAFLIENRGKALPVIGQVLKRHLGIVILDGRSILRVIPGGNAQRIQCEVTA